MATDEGMTDRRYLTDRKFCPHCDEYVSLKTYKYHKRLHFDSDHDLWLAPSGQTASQEEPMSSESAPSSPSSILLEPELINQDYSPPRDRSLSFDIVENSTSDSDFPVDNDACEIWNIAEEEISDDIQGAIETSATDMEQEDEFTETPDSPLFSLSRWLLHFVVLMQSIFRLSDVVINYFLAFLKTFFMVLGRNYPVGREIAQHLPSTLYRARKTYQITEFRRYVVCRKCHKLYYSVESLTSKQSRLCSFRRFPFHPWPTMRRPCGSLLLKTVEIASGKKLFYPFMTYCYVGLEVSLLALVNRPTFLDDCEKWRSREEETALRDVYDGKIWKEFMKYNGIPFLSEKHNLALILNMDFFQPYKHVQYSLGAIYLTVMNLPRDIRYKEENTILLGLIPGPKEPEHDINSFLEPLVEELIKFWEGVELNIIGSCSKVIRCALLCVACDLPAGRKVCGFLGHSARLGCSRCLKGFPGSVGCMDYSGFDRENWHVRDGKKHTQSVLKLLAINTKTGLEKQESEIGCRYSVLVKLPYFDAPRMLIVDPMHNLFLGSAKHFMKLMIRRGLISESQFEDIQQRVDSFTVPSNIGRIPHKIKSGFSSFTADQWKNWVVYFSMISLRDILPSNELECWRHFVLACRVLCSKTLSQEQVKLGDTLLVQFCRRTQRIFGKDSVTPNMHMHCHLAACITDYGPLHGFWLYSFERFNGILGSIPNNNRSIEIQLMRRFLQSNQILSSSFPDMFSSDFLPLLPKQKTAGSIADTLLHAESVTVPSEVHSTTLPEYKLSFPEHHTRHVFTVNQVHNLVELYTEIFSISRSVLEVSSIFKKYSSVTLSGKQLGSHLSRSKSSSIVMATWDYGLFGGSSTLGNSSTCRPARIDCICKNVVTINGQQQISTLVSLSWFKTHPKKDDFGTSVSIWHHDLFESDGIYSLIPIQFIQSRCVSLLDKVDDETVMFVCKCIDF